MKNKKRFKKYLNLLGCCAFVALSGFSAVFNVEKIDNVKAYEETIVNGQNISLDNYSSPLYVVNNGEKLVLNDIVINGDNSTSMDKIISVEAGGLLELNNVSIDNVNADYAIYSLGKVVANDVKIGESIDCDIYISNSTESLVMGKVDIDELYLNQGYIAVDENTRIVKNIDLNLGSAKEEIGSLIVKGDETFAGHYLNKFNYTGNKKYSPDGSVSLDCYLDYVGTTEYMTCVCTGDTCAEKCKKKIAEDGLAAKGLAAGDIVFTANGNPFKKSADETCYDLAQYGTARKFLEENRTPGVVYMIDSNNYDYYKEPYATTGMAIVDNYRYIGAGADKIILIQSASVNTIDTTITTNLNGESLSTQNIVLNAGEDRLVVIEKPEDYDSYTLNVASGLEYVELIDNDAMIVLLLKPSTAMNGSASIVANFEYDATTSVNVNMPTDFTYTGSDQKAALNPYYLLGETEVNLDYVIYENDEVVTEFKNAGNYVVRFVNVADDIELDFSEIAVEIKQKELTINYAGYEGLVYDGEAKTITAELQGVCAGDVVTLTLENATNINAGTYTVVSSIDNSNYKIKSGFENREYVIDRAVVNMAEVVFNGVQYEYSANISMPSVINKPDEVNVNIVCNEEVFLVGSYDVVAYFTLKDTANYYPLSITQMTAQVVIVKKDINVDAVVFADKTVIYDGSDYSLEVTNLPSNIKVTYSANLFKDAGTYSVTATLALIDSANYSMTGENVLEATLIINKASVDMTGIDFDYVGPVEYDGIAKTILLTGELPSYISVTYLSDVANNITNVATQAGNYVVKVEFASLDNNYAAPDMLELDWVISKRALVISLKPNDFTYDGIVKTVEFEVDRVCAQDDVEIIKINDANILAGNYVAKVTGLAGDDKDNYVLPEVLEFEYEIKKATIDMTGVTIQNIERVYDGEEYFPNVTGALPSVVGFQVVHAPIIAVGEYPVLVNFVVNDNYETPNSISALVRVVPKKVVVQFGNTSGIVYDGTEKQIGVEIVGFCQGNIEEYDIVYSARPVEPGEYTCTVRLKAVSNYEIMGANTRTFEILAKELTYSQGDYVLTVTTDGISKNAEISMSKDEIDDSVMDKLNIQHKKIAGVDAFTISIDSDDEETFALKTASVNLKNNKAICLYRITNGVFEKVDCTIRDGVIYFNASNQDMLVLVELDNGENTNNLALILILSIGGTLVLCAGIVIGIVIVKKKAKNK